MTEVSTTEKPGLSYYDILEVALNATDDEIRQAYSRLKDSTYPIKSPSEKIPTAPDLPAASRRLEQLSQACFVLLDPTSRATYDRTGSIDPTARLADDSDRHETRISRYTLNLIENTQRYVDGQTEAFDSATAAEAERLKLRESGDELLNNLASVYLSKSSSFLHRAAGTWTGAALATAIDARAGIALLDLKAGLFGACLEMTTAEKKWREGPGRAGGEEMGAGMEWKKRVEPMEIQATKAQTALSAVEMTREVVDRVLSPVGQGGGEVAKEVLVERAEAFKRMGEIFKRSSATPSPSLVPNAEKS